MAERSKTAPRLLRSRSYVHRFVGAADARIDTESRRPIGGEGNFPPCKALNCCPVLRGKTPRPYAIREIGVALTRSRARSIVLRYLFEFAVSAPDGRGGKFSSLQSLEKPQNAKILAG